MAIQRKGTIMTTEIITGLHSCKPDNAPVIGEVKTFVIEQKVGKSGKPYQKIKSAGTDYGGTPFRILEAEPTGFTDKYNNVSYNLGIEPAQYPPGTILPPGSPPPTQQVQAPSAAPYSMLDERQRAIIRQHSESMALELLKLKQALGELSVEDLTPSKLKQLADFFDQDVLSAASEQ